MRPIYFPGCKYTIHSRSGSQKIRNYLCSRHGLTPTGCCSVHLDRIKKGDTVVYVCPTCGTFIREYTPFAEAVSVWEVLENDEAFPWPDFRGEKMTVQDCWRVRDNRPLQNAVRHILKRMHIEVVEVEDAFEQTDFCGVSFFKPRALRYEKFAPHRFVDLAQDKFVVLPAEEQAKRMKTYCSRFTTEKVVCYCTGCLEGLCLGGVQGIHLMDRVTACV